MLTITGFAQLNTSVIFSNQESETSLIAYKIDEPVTRDVNGGYGFKLKTPIEFTSFVLGWDAITSNYEAGNFEIIYKVHKPSIGWTDWKVDDGFTNPGETRSGFYQSDLLFGIDEYTHDSIEFYIHCPESEGISKIYLILLDISKTINPNTVINTTANGAKACPALPTIIPRSDWCGTSECLNPTYTVIDISSTHTVIHHGASPDSYTDGSAIVRSYWDYHVNYNGWSDIGYNYLVDKYGNLFQGRHNLNMPYDDVRGAHAGASNDYSIGVNFLGNSDAVETAPTTPQLQKCSEFLAWWFDYKGFDPTSSASILNQAGPTWVTLPRICGHKDVNPGGTTCPGTTLYALLPDIISQTNQIILDCTTPSDIDPPTTSISTDRNWYNSKFEVMFSDADNAGGTGVNYSFYQIMDFDGTEWRANNSEGFFNDNFTSSIHPDWTPVSGTWSINSEHIIQTDEISSNTNIYANVLQESGNTYLYNWQQKISGSGSNRRSGIHFFCSDPTGDGRGDSYMLYLRADNNTVQIYEYDDNSYSNTNGWLVTESFTIDEDVWYDVKIILNTTTGYIYIYIDNTLAATATDLTPLTSGSAISLRTGECQTEYDDFKIYKTRNNTIEVLPEISANADIRYQSESTVQEAGRIRTILIDNADNWSENISKNIFTDFDVPETEINVTGEWQTNDFTANFTDSDELSGIEKSLFCVSDFDGTKWTANMQNGFAFNSFDSEIGTEWISQTGTWASSSGTMVQTDEIEGNSNIYAFLQEDLSNRYLYEFDLNINGTDSNKRGGFHYFCDDPTLTNRGNGYFVWFRLESQKLEFYKVTDDVFSLEKDYDIEFNANQWYNVKIIFDRINGDTFLYMNNILVGEFRDSEPYSTGNYVSFRSGNANMSIDNFKVYRSRYLDADISIGNSTSDIRSQSVSPSNNAAMIYSIVNDSAKNISAIISHGVKVDWTPPSIAGLVNDGASSDIDITYELGEISGNWDSFDDANSGVTAYYYSVGTSPGATDLITWTDNGLNLSFTNTATTLIAGSTYFLNIKAENGAGTLSDPVISDGVLAIDTECPEDFEVCISDEAFTLSGASPSGGTYTGPGVSAGVFNPQVAGVAAQTITYTVDGNSCYFIITVNELPIVTCPDDVYLPVDDPTWTIIGSSPIGGTYYIDVNPVTTFNPATNGVGEYEVTYEYTNSPENCTNTCTFTIYVFEPLILDCPEDYSVCIDESEFLLEGATPPGGAYTVTGVTSSTFNPALASIGAQTISYNYDTETCYFIITVNDLPNVECPNNIETTTESSPFSLSGATPTDGIYYIGGNSVEIFDPSLYGEGDFEVTYSYSDNCDNSCTFYINVIEPLNLTCPEDIQTCLDSDPFELSGGTPIGGTYTGPDANEGWFTPTSASLGIQTITYSYDTEECYFFITVNENPLVTCPENITTTVEDSPFPLQSAEPTGGEYTIDGTPITYINPPSYEIGEYTITYTYIDEITSCYSACDFLLSITPYVDINTEEIPIIEVYPNPNDGHFTIRTQNSKSRISYELFSIDGKLIKHGEILPNDEITEMNAINMFPGVYFLKLKSAKISVIKKISISK